ncbi:MAG TPA: virulence factor [Candidatus Dormibacteraeota bacterium]|nr:virulence factor [Candidatus Dormibacteraeota bacterium]
MASYQVMYWKHIPSQVKAWEGQAEVKRMLPDYFQAAIDAYAMKDGSTEMDAYLDGWHWGGVEERAGAPHEVVAAVIDEITGANPRSRLMNPEPAG